MIRMPLTLRRLDPKTGLPMPAEPVWGSDLERGLYIQKYPGPLGVWYGVTHQSGWGVSGPGFSYLASRMLQVNLLNVGLDWAQPVEALLALRDAQDMHWAVVKAVLRIWNMRYGAWHREDVEDRQRLPGRCV